MDLLTRSSISSAAFLLKVTQIISFGETPLDKARGKTASLLRKHSGKTKKELEAEEK